MRYEALVSFSNSSFLTSPVTIVGCMTREFELFPDIVSEEGVQFDQVTLGREYVLEGLLVHLVISVKQLQREEGVNMKERQGFR